MGKTKNDLLQDTLALLVLETRSQGALDGYGITLHIQLVSKDILRIEEGSLYPALDRMEAVAQVLQAHLDFRLA